MAKRTKWLPIKNIWETVNIIDVYMHSTQMHMCVQFDAEKTYAEMAEGLFPMLRLEAQVTP